MSQLSLSRLAARGSAPCDLLVIGGGIVGAGVARDAALRGLRILLVEQSDFASGTSSRSSRLLHGGLRYLGQGRLGLVWEASTEKMRLRRLAPHLSEPLPFYFPVWKGDPWPRWMLSAGVLVYGLLCGGRNLGSPASYGRRGMLRQAPGLRPEGLTGGVRYFDALTNDARLAIDTLRSASLAGAEVLNYTSFESAAESRGGWTCRLRDRIGGGEAQIRARVVVNAAGAWAAGFPQSDLRLRLTKGVHLVIDRARLPVEGAVVLSEGPRILFVIPWGERAILGTTDTDYTGDPAAVRTGAADIDYILKVVNRGFPNAALGPEDVISAWAGIRPLIAPRHEAAGAPSDISRAHVIRMPQPGWFDIAGGKLTTYRRMAEQAVDRAGRFLKAGLPRSATARFPLLESAEVRYSGVLPPPVECAVVEHCCRREWVVHLDDLLLRRTSWHYYHARDRNVAELASQWAAGELGWSEDCRRAELERYFRTAEFWPRLESGTNAP
ncbi:MAG: glycerol-3-phosphate dehydrogenase/oxidase [Acidobacteria bacterium]|nr:glycerol-3-phosphate dehydrogenase/oxidase [Acidobacteriota bacterium]